MRGNVEGFIRNGSTHNYLELHGLEHFTHFYTDYGMNLQKQFFGHFLKNEDTGWKRRPGKVQLQIRHPGEHFEERFEETFPIPRTQYKRLYLNPDNYQLTETPYTGEKTISYRGMSDGVTFFTKPLENEIELTGYAMSQLLVSSSTCDADMFLVLRLFKPDMTEITFRGANDPHVPIAQGWLRASHRKIDTNLSTEYRPFHTHDEIWPLIPGKPETLNIEIWPHSIVIPKGYRLALTIRGKDYEYQGAPIEREYDLHYSANPMSGNGNLLHNDPFDRPNEVYDGEVTLHFGPDTSSYLQVPVIPKI